MSQRSVFIGNIPYGVTDEAIKELFSRVGEILSYRALTDKDTGKPRGYAFAEFADADAAASAVRNLNDHEMQGRKLRVDYANDKSADNETHHRDHNQHVGSSAGAAAESTLPPLPSGRDIPIGFTAEDAISKTLDTIPPTQLLDILSQMQGLVVTDPPRAQSLLDKSPQLSYAIFQVLLLLNLVDQNSLSSIIQQSSASASGQGQPVQLPFETATPPSVAPAPAATQPSYDSTAQDYAPAPFQLPGYPPVSAPPVPPVQQYQAPIQQPTPAQQAVPQVVPQVVPQASLPQAAPPPDKAALIQQVLAMTQQQVDALQPAERAQIMSLRSQLTQTYGI